MNKSQTYPHALQNIVMIGAGNLATQLSLSLQQAGHNIRQVYSRTEAHAKVLAQRLGCGHAFDAKDLCATADIYIIAVKDDAISEVISTICHNINTNAIVIHTAGSAPMTVFKAKVEHYGVLYPMQTFSKDRNVDFREIPCFIEASDETSLKALHLLAENISSHVVEANFEQRKRLHLAAVLACNLANHCYRLAEKVLEKEHIDFRLYLPLINETARKVSVMSPREAQTGPMVRNDKEVMNMQMSLIDDERTQQIYRLMAESIHEDCK